MSDLQNLYAALNREYFEDSLPSCAIKWSRRLTRAAGVIEVRKPEIRLSIPLLQEPFQVLIAPQFQICGVACSSFESALREILKHEMIHLWLFVHGKPHGHTNEFRLKAREIGQPRTRHNIALPPPTSGWIYRCAVCRNEVHRRRRFGKSVACAACCKTHSKGKYDPRFKLRGQKI